MAGYQNPLLRQDTPLDGQLVTVKLKVPIPVESFTGVIHREIGGLVFTGIGLFIEPSNVEAYFEPLEGSPRENEG